MNNELETVLKVLGEKINSLSLEVSCNKWQIEKLEKENKDLKEELSKAQNNEMGEK